MKTLKWKKGLSILMSVVVLCGTMQGTVLPVFAMDQQTETSEFPGTNTNVNSEEDGENKSEEPIVSEENDTTLESGNEENKKSDALTGNTESNTDSEHSELTDDTNKSSSNEETKETEIPDADNSDTKIPTSDQDPDQELITEETTEITNTETITTSVQRKAAARTKAAEDGIYKTGTCDSNISWTLYEDGRLEIEPTDAGKNAYIQNCSNGHASPWYNYRTRITDIYIKSGVSSIGNYAFEKFPNLDTLMIEEGLTSIGSYAFSDCFTLRQVTFPETLQTLNMYAFSYCTSLERIEIPDSVTRMEQNNFSHCTSLTYVKVSSGLKTLTDNSFNSCYGLTEVVLPQGITKICNSAFKNCSNLLSVNIPEKVTDIEINAFNGCTSLRTLILPSTLTTIGISAFENCPKLSELTLPVSLKTVLQSAYSSDGLKKITLHSNQLSTIGTTAFGSGIEEIVIGKEVKTITPLFINAVLQDNSSAELSFEGPNCFTYSGNTFTTDHLTIKSGTYYASQEGALYLLDENTKTATLLKCPSAFPKEEGSIQSVQALLDVSQITLENGTYKVTAIGDHVFEGRSDVTSITIPTHIETIGTSAFAGCTRLTGVTFSGTVNTLGASAFAGCTSLHQVNIVGEVKAFGTSAFAGCTKLNGITVKGTTYNSLMDVLGQLNASISSFENTGLTSGSSNSGTANNLEIYEKNAYNIQLDVKSSTGSRELLTGEKAEVDINIDQIIGENLKGKEVVVYFQFEEGNTAVTTDEDGNTRLFGYPLDTPQTFGSYSTNVNAADPITGTFQYTGTPGAYRLVLTNLNAGSTLNLNLPVSYENGSSGGGSMLTWMELRNVSSSTGSSSGGTTSDTTSTQKTDSKLVTWKTQPDKFTVSKSHYAINQKTLQISGDGTDGSALYVQNLAFQIKMDRDSTNSSAYGKDYVKTMEFSDTLDLKDSALYQWREGLADAINVGNYEFISTSSNSSSNQTRTIRIDVHIGSNTYTLATISGPAAKNGGYYGPSSLAVDEDGDIRINWTWCNSKNQTQEITVPTFTLTYGDQVIVAKDTPNEKTDTTVKNKVSATENFTYGESASQDDEATAKVNVTPADFSISKNAATWGVNMGTRNTYTITLTNGTSLHYTDLTRTEDALDPWFYIEPADMATMFNDINGLGKRLTIQIRNAKLYENSIINETVYATDKKSPTLNRPLIGGDTTDKYAFDTSSPEQEAASTTNATITIKWKEHENLLEMTVNDGTPVTIQPKSYAIQDALDAIGYAVTDDVQYICTWDMTDFTLFSGQSRSMQVIPTVKTSFMMLKDDQRYYYTSSTGSFKYVTNTANAYYNTTGTEQKKSAGCGIYIWKDYTLSKSVLLNGKAITSTSRVLPGDVLTYTATVTRESVTNVTADALPVVDHMQGGQILLVPVNQNTALKNKNLETVTVNGTNYYILSEAGTYENVMVGGYLAEKVIVSKTDAGLDTMIYWYLNTAATSIREFKFTYQALVDLDKTSISLSGSDQYELNNKVWLGDDAGNRLYDICSLYGYMVQIDKYEVTNAEADLNESHNPAADKLTKRSTVSPGKKVTYRLMLGTLGTGSANISGSSIYDELPGSVNNYWSKDNVSVVYVAADGSTMDITPGDGWYIENDTKSTDGITQQSLRWSNNFSIHLSGTGYIYVTLEFPKDTGKSTAWEKLCEFFGAAGLINTWHVYDMTDAVSHDMAIQAEVRLQKGVYATGSNTKGSDNYTINSDNTSLLYYSNNSNNSRGIVTYYVSLYNSGETRMYISDIQDVLPEGFTLAGMYYPGRLYYSGSAPLAYHNANYYNSIALVKDGTTKIDYKKAVISADTEVVDDHQMVTFHITNAIQSSALQWDSGDLLYDEELDRYYLMPGQALVFAYNCYTGSYANSKDAAKNMVAMEYYDYNGAGAVVDPDAKISSNTQKTSNDGGCETLTTKEAEELGFDAGSKSSSSTWLSSDVTVERGTIVPGIRKVSKVEQASTTDTIAWEITAYNNGTGDLRDYTLTDVMMEPYEFTGTVNYAIYLPSASSPLVNTELFQFADRTDTSVTLLYDTNKKTQVTLDGTTVTIPTQIGNAEVSISYDSSKNEILSIRMMDVDEGSIPAGGKAILSVNTKNNSNLNENKTFINKCYLTPNTQSFDKNSISQGIYTDYDLPSDGNSEQKPSVVDEAQVSVSYGYATRSLKSVTEQTTNGKSAYSTSDANYIVLSEDMDSTFRYELQVENSGGNSIAQNLNLMVMVDNLPEIGDHSTFYTGYPRYSEFQVDFAKEEDLDPVVTIELENGKTRTLTTKQYTLQFSKQTNLDYENNVALWEGEELSAKDGWYTLEELKADEKLDLQDMRSVRLVVQDPKETGLIPAKSTTSFSFNAVVHAEEEQTISSAKIAWNTFGYLYQIGSMKLQAAPLKVGVKLGGVPEIVKNLVDDDKNPYEANKDETFLFLICKGGITQLDNQNSTADKFKWLTEMAIPFTVVEVPVAQGSSSSETLVLDHQKVCTYDEATNSYKETDVKWTWTDRANYTVEELLEDSTAENYSFGNINSNKVNQYVFTYDKAERIYLEATNIRNFWTLQINKTDGTGNKKLSGAIFGLYSKDQSKQLAQDAALPGNLNIKPEWTKTVDNETWYLIDIQTTDENGQLKWSGLTEDEFYVLEIQAPFGYRLGKEPGQVVRWSNGMAAQQLNIVNASIFQLPHSGGMGTKAFTASGACLLTGGLLYMLLKRRKRLFKFK